MADNTISIKVQADIAAARTALQSLTSQVKESGRAATSAEKEAITAAKNRVKELNRVARAEKELNTLGVRSQREIKAEMDKVTAALEKLGKNSAVTGSDMTRATQAAKEKLSELKQELDGGVTLVDKFKGAWDKLAATVGAGTALAVAAKQAIDFEDALVDLQRAANITRDEADEMGVAFKDLSEELGVSALGIAKLATEAAKVGIAKGDLVEFARVTTQAALNFDMIPEEAGEAMAQLKGILGIAVTDMEAFAGEINLLADTTQAAEKDIVTALRGGGSTARMFGLNAKQAAALAAAMLDVGASADVAGTAMRTLLARLQLATTDTDKAGEALQSVTGDSRAFARSLSVDANGALLKFMQSLSKMDSQSKAIALNDLFGQGLDTSVITALTNDMDKFAATASIAAKSDDELVKSLRELTELKLGSTQSELNILAASWQNAGQALGELFLPVIRATAIALSALAQSIRYLAENVPGLTMLATAGALVATAFTPLKLIFSGLVTVGARLGAVAGTIAASFGGILTAVKWVGPALATLWTNMTMGVGVMASLRLAFVGVRVGLGALLGPVGLVITGLTLLWDAWSIFGKDTSSKKAVEEQRKAFEAVGESMKSIGDAAVMVKDQIFKAMADAKAPIENLAKGYKDISEGIKASLTERIAAIDAAATRETQIMQANHLGQRDTIRETARIMLEAETKKIQAVDQAGKDMLSAWERTYGQALAVEEAAGIKGSNLTREAKDAKIAIYQQIEAAYKSTIDKLIAEEQRNLAAVKQIEQERLMLKMSVEDKLRALKQKTMTDEQAYADRVKQIDDKLAAARDANAKGNAETAKRLWNEAISLAQSNANAVTKTVEANGKSTQQTVVTLEKAVETSSAQIQQAYKGLDGQLVATAQTGVQSAGALNTQAQSVTNQWAEVRKELDALRAEKAVEIDATLTANTETAQAAIDQLKALGAAESAVVRVDAELKEANASLAAWKNDPTNKDLALAARVDQAALDTTIANLKTSLEAAKLQAPTDLDTAKAHETFAALTKTLNETETKSKHTIDDQSFKEAQSWMTWLDGQSTESNHTVKDNAAKVQSAINDLKANTSSIHTVYIRKVEKNAAGGLAGWSQRFRDGGQAFRRRIGKIIGAGTATSDSIPAMLSNGEFVIRAAMVRKWGASFFEALNRGMMPPMPKYAMGGAVNIPDISGGSGETLTWLIRAGESEVPVRVQGQDSRKALEAMTKELTRVKLLQG